jgi:5-methyltetrahydrofolate--homocysteine methyltransferase
MRGKLVKDLKEVIRLSGLEDGMTISFHHHLRNGDMVAVMVKNHGYRVIDLGKNVPAESFVEAVVEHKAEFLGLRALMTTTMQEIPAVIALLREKSPQTKVIIGGAVITEEFAQEAGADGFGRDAVQTVKLMDEFLNAR